MRFRNRLRRWTAVAILASVWCVPLHDVATPAAVPPQAPPPEAPLADAAGGWLPVHLNACALGVGLMAGGVAGLPLNPMGGATAFGVGFGIVLLYC